jgi:hypothetical protein
MIERREHLCLALKPSHTVGIESEGRRQDFECHVAVELRVPSPTHFPHAARADGREDFVRSETSPEERA